MEIEAKFNAPDREVLQRLRAWDRLVGFHLTAGRAKRSTPWTCCTPTS